MLSGEQLAEFRRDGCLTVRSFFGPDEVAGWRRQVDDHFGHPRSPEEWDEAVRHTRTSAFRLTDGPTPHDHPGLRALLSCLRDDVDWCGDTDLQVRPPEPGARWLGARAPHVDFPVGRPMTDLVNVTLYLSDVASHGGAFLYWPGSHAVTWEHLARHPLDYRSRGDRGQPETFALIRAALPTEPREFVGRAGDVLVWHSLTMHSPSVNQSTGPRIAVIGRWGVADGGADPAFDFTGPWHRGWRLPA